MTDQIREAQTIEIKRIIIKSRRNHFVPARYLTRTKFIALTPDEEIERYCGGPFKTFNNFIQAIQKKFGNNYNYDIDRSKPYVHYI